MTAEGVDQATSVGVAGLMELDPATEAAAVPAGKGAALAMSASGADRVVAKHIVIPTKRANNYANEQLRQLNVGLLDFFICQAGGGRCGGEAGDDPY